MKNKIKQFREEKGITLLELAHLSNVSIGYLSHLEHGGRNNPSFNVMSKFSSSNIRELFFVSFSWVVLKADNPLVLYSIQ